MDVQQVSWTSISGWSGAIPAPDARESLVLAFGASELIDAPAPFHDLVDLWGAERVVGCSTPFATSADDARVALMVSIIRFDRTRVVTAHADIQRAGGSRRAARRVGNLLSEPSLQCAVMLADGLMADGSQLSVGMRDVTDGVNRGIWRAIGVEETSIRANPQATNDPLLIGVFGVAGRIS